MASSCHGLDISKILGPNLRLYQTHPFISKLCEKFVVDGCCFIYRNTLLVVHQQPPGNCLRWHGIKSIFVSRVDSNSYVGQRKGEPRLLTILAFILFFLKEPFHKKMTAIIGKHYNVFTADQTMDSISLSATLL